jgi:DNA-directed RNA polymerase specialized sigma24 family protein
MVDRPVRVLGRASRGVVADIDKQLSAIEGELGRYEQLLTERERLRAARAALTREHPGQISQDDVAGYLAGHPGVRAGEIAKALGVPLATVSSHLYRGKRTRFVNRVNGWHLREQQPKPGGRR